MSKREFQTEVSQLLQLIVHSLYSHPEIFLRELISNSSDALDKLRHLTLVDDAYKSLPFSPRIDLELDETNKTLTVADTGIGMNEEELVSNLGTIARSGTKNFLSQLSGDAKKDSNLIGQFGVGFYSVFMVADRVEVVSRKAGEDEAWRWISDGKTGFEIEPADRDCRRHHRPASLQRRRQAVRQQLAPPGDRQEIFQPHRLSHLPHLRQERVERDGKEVRSRRASPNRSMPPAPCGAAPRASSKTKITRNSTNPSPATGTIPCSGFTPRRKAALEYTTLFFVPSKAPLDLYQAEYKGGVKLYVKRVFIMDDSKELAAAVSALYPRHHR